MPPEVWKLMSLEPPYLETAAAAEGQKNIARPKFLQDIECLQDAIFSVAGMARGNDAMCAQAQRASDADLKMVASELHMLRDALRPLMGDWWNKGGRFCPVLPRKANGGVEFVLNMLPDEMELLLQDEEFGHCAAICSLWRE